jgi:protein SCO1/2
MERLQLSQFTPSSQFHIKKDDDLLIRQRYLQSILIFITALLFLINPALSVTSTVAQKVSANGNSFNEDSALRLSQAAIGTIPSDYTFLDRQERPVRLANYRGKPLLVSFIYTGCFQICPATTKSLNDAIENLKRTIGTDQFNVISIGFNQPFDSPQALRIFASKNDINAPNWEFLSPHESIVESLTRDFGFSYASNQSGIDHVLEITVLDGQGRIYSQIYGGKLDPEIISAPILQLLRGAPLPQALSLSDVINRVRLICTVYDPVTGRYRYDYSLILEIAGGCTFLIAMLWLYIDERLKRRRSRKQTLKNNVSVCVRSPK